VGLVVGTIVGENEGDSVGLSVGDSEGGSVGEGVVGNGTTTTVSWRTLLTSSPDDTTGRLVGRAVFFRGVSQLATSLSKLPMSSSSSNKQTSSGMKPYSLFHSK